MIVCVLDDLLFSVKIKTVAKALGADVYFEREASRVVDTVRNRHPGLVIFDLNGSRPRPMEAIAKLKADAELRGIRTLGYVSHVDGETVAAARQAGCDEVLARSAFVERLGRILTSVR